MLRLIAKAVAALVVSVGLFLAVAYAFDPSAMRQRLGLTPPLDVPYVATRTSMVEAMLEMAEVGEGNYVIDLGTGDGRILIAAAQDRGARGLGVDLDPALVAEATRTAARLGLSDRLTFAEQDLFDTPLAEADVVTMFLLPEVNLRLRPRLLAELRPGARVVSNRFDMGDWRPDETRRVAGYEAYAWIIPAKVGGDWVLAEGGASISLTLVQHYQDVRGTATLADGSSVPVTGVLEGEAMRLTVLFEDGARSFAGRVGEGRFVPDDAGEGWSATR
ncbi:SAM-dependent methyltransferase [Erythrobacter sp. EC-HK427]|uniref:SAM-dependent methyltransferase n=1 Tax=Erythrobacter sp. EC-HK427 TaxID=2038396 RepID=UPI0012539F22|nr:class I SAM-dependent methyltransferase [Erythrobacter sp. EC-HK427]VVT12384.1 conserved hypothetical protein [Erythrobacter sp. EC-HK427]